MNSEARVKLGALAPITSEKQLLAGVNNIISTLIPLVGQHANKNEKVVQWADLLAAGLITGLTFGSNGEISGIVPDPVLPDMTTPPAIVDFAAVASFNFVTLSWEQPRYKNHSYVEVWRASSFKKNAQGEDTPTTLSDAVFRFMTTSIMGSDTVLPGDLWRYWARNVSKTGVYGQWTSVDGLAVSVPESPSYLIDKISGEIREGDLYPALGDKIDASYVGVNEHTAQLILQQAELQKHTAELQKQADELVQHGTVLAQHTNTIAAQGASITQQGVIITGHTSLLTQHTTQLTQHGNSITEQSRILTTHESTLASHSQTLATQNSAISDLKTITETHDATLLQHSQTLVTQGASIGDLRTITQTHDGVLAQHTSQIATANANITSVTQIVDSQGRTLAEHTQTLSSHGTAIQQQAQINTDQGALINAAWTVRIDSGKAVSGFGLMVDGATGRSDFIIRADRFAIAAPQAYDQAGKPIVNNNAFPFIVDVTNPAVPKTLIKNAYIDQAFIQTLVTGSLVADRITGQTLTGTHIRGGDMAIGSNFNVDGAGSMTALNAFLRGTMQSSNYGAGVSGWQIHNNGNAEFNTAVVRGIVYASGGWFQGTVYAEKMVGGVYSYASKATADNTGVTTVGQWVSAFGAHVTRGMAVGRKMGFKGTVCRAELFAAGTSSGGSQLRASAVYYVRVLRDGAEVASQAFTINGSASFPYPSGGASFEKGYDLEVDFVVDVPSDSLAHVFEVQYVIASATNDASAQTVRATVSTLAAGSPVQYRTSCSLFITTGDLV